MNLIFGMFIDIEIEILFCVEYCTTCNISPVGLLLRQTRIIRPKGFTLTLQETRSIHDSMNIPKIEFIAYIYILL